MSLYESSDDIGITVAETPKFDRWHGQARPATGTQTTITNRQGPAPVPYVAAKDGKFRGNDGVRDVFFIGWQQGGFPGGNIGMKIAKPGGNALTDPLSSLLFYWDFSTGTQYWNDPLTGRNYQQNGILPDGTGGWVNARAPYNVADVYS